MPKVRDVRIGLWPELLKEQADKEMQKLKEIVQGRMSEGMKKAGKAARGEVDKIKKSTMQAMGHGGILGIIKEIQAAIQSMRGDVEAMTGVGGSITDIAYALGTSEERLMQVYHAFGQAGMGSTQVIDDMLQQFQSYVANKENEGVDILEGRDTLHTFLDLLTDLDTMNKEQQDALIAEVFGSKKVFGMQKLLGSWSSSVSNETTNNTMTSNNETTTNNTTTNTTNNSTTSQQNITNNTTTNTTNNNTTHNQGARAYLSDATVRSAAIRQAQGAREASRAGDKIEYIRNSSMWERMAIYVKKAAYNDVVDVARSEEEDNIRNAEKLQKGDILEAYNMSSGIEEAKNLLINLPMAIVRGLKAEIPEPEGVIAKGVASVFPWAGRLGAVIDNIGNDLETLIKKFETIFTRNNNSGGDI